MNTYRIPNLARACQVLRLVSETARPLSTSDVARALKMPRTTALRIMHTFVAEQFLVRDGLVFRRGPMLDRLVAAPVAARPDPARLREAMQPALRHLANATDETSHFAVMNGDLGLIVDVWDSPRPVRVASRPGTEVALHAAATGKALLAFAFDDAAARQRFLAELPRARRTRHTLVTVAALEAECLRTRARGFALDDEEYHDGVRCLAAPVRDASGAVVAAIGITGSIATVVRRRISQLARQVIDAADDVSRALGAGDGDRREAAR